MSSGRATLRASPRKKNKPLPSPRLQQHQQQANRTALPTPINTSATAGGCPEEEADNVFGQGATAGPSSPTRRRRRPSAGRRRSSSITAAAALISSYSTSPVERANRDRKEDGYDKGHEDEGESYEERDFARGQGQQGSQDGGSEEDFGGDAVETVQDARQAFGRGRASPYHMALVTLLFSLAQGMPLASQFKVYSYMMCQVFQRRTGAVPMFTVTTLPSAPELPSDPICEDVWVENATSTYAAAMATVGALLSLVLLNRCSRLSEYFGRKPLLLITQILLALSTLVFRLSILLPTYVGVAVLYVAVMVLEASAGAPLKIAIQNYVVDTTSETQRAGALSFTDGFGQVGAFPSSTLGGLLAAVTHQFFAPFYASLAVYAATTAYLLVFVPESKKRRHHTMIDDFEHLGESDQQDTPTKQSQEEDHQSAHEHETEGDTDADTDGGIGTESYFSSVDGHTEVAWWRKLLYRLNFLAPLSVFLPRTQATGLSPTLCAQNWRLPILALIVILEESFQVFLVPVLLLYNTRVFGYDVVQNGYLVSLLQGTRALYLTVCFPWAVGKARAWVQRRKRRDEDAPPNERTPLARSRSANDEESESQKSEERGKLDITIMLLSYLLCGASFCLMATTRAWSARFDEPKGEQGKRVLSPWIGVAVAIVGVQLGAGATSLRTALLVKAVSEREDQREAREQREELRQRRGHNGPPGLDRRTSGLASLLSVSTSSADAPLRVHHDRHQSKALAANQILCTAVYALVPLLTSRIFGAGLQIDRPELVWFFKAGMAGASALATLILLLGHR